MEAEKRYVELILGNLLENAWKYIRAGGAIRIAARREGESICVTIGNNGSIIAEESREVIFERFHPAPWARTYPATV